jgi:hydrogenase-4 component B
MIEGPITPLAASLAAVIAWLAIALAGVIFPKNLRLVSRVLFPAGALVALILAAAGMSGLAQNAETLVLPLGLPDLPFHLRLDALSAFFLLLLGSVTAGVSVFASGYFRRGEGTLPGLLCLYYHVFIASMTLRSEERRVGKEC